MEIVVLALIATVVFISVLFAFEDSPMDEIKFVLAFCITGLVVIGLSQTGPDFLGILLIPSAALALTIHPPNDSRYHQNEPTYWFAVLKIARERGDFERANEAKHQLERLGICVSYQRPQKGAVR